MLVTKDHLIRQEYGPIDLKAGKPVQDVGFLLQSAPTIAGWVRDEFGEPLPNALIQAWRRGYDPRGKRILSPFASTLTDERGLYRLFWLDPGEYIVSGRSSAESTNGFFTYYPGFADSADAEAVQLRAGREVGGVDFKTDRGTLLMVGGSVVDGVTKRSIAVRVTLTAPGDARSPIHYQVQTDARGMFSIDGVAPGTYIASGAAGDYHGFTTIVVTRNRNYPYVRLDLWPSVELKGNIVADPGASLDLHLARVALASIEPALPSPAAVGIHTDRSFSLAGVSPGTYGLAVNGLPDDTYIKVARYGQNPLQEGSLELVAGTVPQQLQVLLGTDGGQIHGTVLDTSGHPRFGAHSGSRPRRRPPGTPRAIQSCSIRHSGNVHDPRRSARRLQAFRMGSPRTLLLSQRGLHPELRRPRLTFAHCVKLQNFSSGPNDSEGGLKFYSSISINGLRGSKVCTE